MNISELVKDKNAFKQLLGSNILQVIEESITVTGLDGRVVSWNKGAEKIFGYKQSEAIGKDLSFFYPEINKSQLTSILERVLNGEDYIGELKGRKKNGEDVRVNMHVTVLKDKNGNIIGFIGLSRDITEATKTYKYKSELSTIVEYSEDGIESMDLFGNILSWNKGAERIYGYTAKEIVGKKANVLYLEKSRDELNKNLEIIKAGESIKSFQTKRKNKNGETIYVSISLSPLKNEKKEIYGVSVITRDLTEQKQTLKELIESEIKYQTIFENSGEGFLLIDEKIIDCNKKLCEMWGYSKKEIIGKTPGDFSPKFQTDGTLSVKKAEAFVKEARHKGIVTYYWQHLTKEGDIVETKVTLSRIRIKGIYHIMAVVQDLSEIFKYQNKLKAKSKELQEHNEEILKLNAELNESNIQLKIINKQIDLSEKKFRVAFKTSPDAININRLSDGRYIEINNGFTQLTGYGEKDIIDKNPFLLNLWVNENDRKKLIEELKKYNTVLSREVKFRRKDSTIGVGLLSASIIGIDGEEHYISITRDISERKSYEEKLEEARKKAEESDRLKSAFLANMSHEIRTPMNAILGFSQLLKEKEMNKEKQDKFLDIIITRSKNLLQIINDIIDISKIEANQLKLEIQRFSLNRMLYELFSIFEAELVAQNKVNVKLDFQTELDKEASFIESDELRLKQILTNLISNAIKFTDEGKVEFGYSIEDNMLRFFVSDTGTGIPQKAIGQIFERFRQADDSSTREYGGTGLGLSISKQLVEMLGGKIWVKSEQNKGSKFYFTVPFKPCKVFETKKRVEDKHVDLSGKRIMVVEDDKISMAYLEELLLVTKANIIKAYDGKDAVNKFKAEQNIDLILMDIHLPIMSGNEATREIKNLKKSVPIVVQSAFALPGEKKESFKYGCDEYITKPIDHKLLFSTIRKFLI